MNLTDCMLISSHVIRWYNRPTSLTYKGTYMRFTGAEECL